MKKTFILLLFFITCFICNAQSYDPTIPSQRVPYAKKELSVITTEMKYDLPVQINDFVVWENVYVDYKSRNIIFRYSVDDSVMSMSEFAADAIRKDLVEYYKYDDDSSQLCWDAVVLKLNILYKYVGYHSKQQKIIKFTYNELRKYRNFADWL